MTNWTAITRRSFLAGAAATGAAVAFNACDKPTKPADMGTATPPVVTATDDNPIVMHPDDKAAQKFFGDDPMRFHPLLWNKQGSVQQYGGLPTAPDERVKVCVVGAGLAGLSTAYQLREFKPLVLEGAVRLGGNAKAHRWGGVTYGMGSAYITNATHGDEHMKMLADLGLTGRFDDPTHDQMYVSGIVHKEFWFGGSDQARAADFRAAWNYFEKVRKSAYPEIPFDPNGDLTKEQWTALDQRSFADEVRAQLGKHLHPHVEEVIRQYCWSSFGADHTEISAAAGLNFLASDLGGMFVFPGGNATISQGLVDRLRRDNGADSVRSSVRVIDIRRVDAGVHVTYLGADEKLHTVLADTCVVSTPKFVAKKLIDDLPQDQLDAMAKIKYRAYIVGHVLINQHREPDFHDLYCIAGQAVGASLKDEVHKRPFTDCVLATFATNGHPDKTVLNLFRGLPYDESRAELYQDGSYARSKELMEPAIPVIVKALGMDPSKVHDFRMSGWGHAMVIPTPGLISSGVTAKASAPHHDRIFFAQQDNNAMSAFESGFYAAADAAERVGKVLAA
jgi:protoporphyrinogen oxidase